MGRLNKGAIPTAGNNSDVFLKKEEKGSFVVLLVGKDGISSSDLQRTCFERMVRLAMQVGLKSRMTQARS